MLVVLAVCLVDFDVKGLTLVVVFLSSVFLGFSSVETGLKTEKNYKLSQSWTQKTTKKTVKTTSKVHPNYEEGGQKKIGKLKFFLKGGSL